MRAGIIVSVTPQDRIRLDAIIADRNTRQKHAARARVIVATADGCGTTDVMRRSGLSKPVVWRWQERLVARRPFDPAAWRGPIGIAATDHQTILLLPRLMRRLGRDAPLMDVKVVPFLASMLGDLRDGQLSLSFGIADQPLPAGLKSEPLSCPFATSPSK